MAHVTIFDAWRDGNNPRWPVVAATFASERAGQACSLVYEVQAGGNYYLLVRSCDGTSWGSYRLRIRPAADAASR